MLTKLIIRNFKRFGDVAIELGNPVVLIGPNNSGKTTALQGLVLWEVGLKRWFEKRSTKSTTPDKRPGVAINRRDLVMVPVPTANLLWRNLHVRSVSRREGKQSTRNIRIDVIVDGITDGQTWSCGLEFDYANEESFYCRPLHLEKGKNSSRMDIPDAASKVRFAFLPPISGLAAQETSLEPGAINVRIGEGRTAEVLRNLCYQIIKPVKRLPGKDLAEGSQEKWNALVEQIKLLFGVTLNPPEYITERGEIIMSYKERSGVTLDLSSAGRGLQQTLLLLAYMYANPGAVLLLDEPDAHLEILRQRQIYQLLTEVASKQGSQIIAATHSEVVLNEAAERDVVVAFVGKPHRLVDRGSQLLKSLTILGFDQYYQAEEKKWVLYLEGATDLAILKAFADIVGHGASHYLERPFVHYVTNQPQKAREHFYGLREAVPDLKGVSIFDWLEQDLQKNTALFEMMWDRREIENYLCFPEVLKAYARADQPDDLFGQAEAQRREQAMDEIIRDLVPPVALRDLDDPWWVNTKASDEFLDRLFAKYFAELKLPNLMGKTNYHQLARLVPKELILPEVVEKLDAILRIAKETEPSP